MKFKTEKVVDGNYVEKFHGRLPFNINDPTQIRRLNKDLDSLIRNEWIISRLYREAGSPNDLYKEVDIKEVPKNTINMVNVLTNSNIQRVELRDPILTKEINLFFRDFINEMLNEGNKGYLSSFEFQNSWSKYIIPDWYNGTLFQRDNDLPFFIEWKKSLDMTFHRFWTYGTWGFIMKKKFTPWLRINNYEEHITRSFMNDMYAWFTLDGEMDELIILTREKDYIEIEKMIEGLTIK